MLEHGRDLVRQTGAFNHVIEATRLMGRLAWAWGDDMKATRCLQECLDLAQEHRYPREAALARVGMALVAGERGEYDQAVALCEQALPDLPPADDEAWVMALCAQGRIALLRKQQADRRQEESTPLPTVDRRPSTDAAHLSSVDGPRSAVAPMTDDRGTMCAVAHYRVALAHLRPGESRPDICEVVEFLAWALAADGQHDEASRLLAFAEHERTEMGIVLPPIDRPHHQRALDAVRTALDETTFTMAWAEGQAMDMAGMMALAEGKEHDR